MHDLFSEKDLEELYDWQELFKDMEVNGVKIVCFEVICNVVHKNKIYSVDEILYSYHQLKIVVDYSRELEWLDHARLDSLLPKAKQLLLNTKREIERSSC